MIDPEALHAPLLPAEGRTAVNAALGLPRAAPVRIKTLRDAPADAEAQRGPATIRFFTAGGVVDVRLPEGGVEDVDFDLWPWVLERLREQRVRFG